MNIYISTNVNIFILLGQMCTKQEKKSLARYKFLLSHIGPSLKEGNYNIASNPYSALKLTPLLHFIIFSDFRNKHCLVSENYSLDLKSSDSNGTHVSKQMIQEHKHHQISLSLTSKLMTPNFHVIKYPIALLIQS